jgi:hypothetical protein
MKKNIFFFYHTTWQIRYLITYFGDTTEIKTDYICNLSKGIDLESKSEEFGTIFMFLKSLISDTSPILFFLNFQLSD